MSHIMSQFPLVNLSRINSLFRVSIFNRFLACFFLVVLVAGFVSPRVSAAESKPSAVAMQTVNINRADAQTIANVLTGVGEKRAAAIVAWREKNGPYTDVNQLLAIKGIGEKVLAKNTAHIVLK